MDLARLAAGVLHAPAPAPEPTEFAAAELGHYLARLTGRRPARRAVPGLPGAWLWLGPRAAAVPAGALAVPPGAEAATVPTEEGVAVVGTSPRALLAAVYSLLEAAGCRWSPRGAADELVPAARAAAVPALVLRPPFARRAYAADLGTWHYTVPERLAARLPGDVAFVDWMAKSGATGLLFIRHANDTQWVIPALVPELRRRGLDVEGGGHALVELLPRSLYATHPEYFPVGADGRRSDLGNACASSREALALIRGRARAAGDAIPGATDLHLWPLDLVGGGWCRCDACAPLTPSDQALRVGNEAAEGVAGRIYHLAYHDTLRPPRTVRPHPRVWAEFAPRERCYAHALDDPGCTTNGRYRDALAAHLALFDGRVCVFEYYGDAILFGGCAVPLVETIGRDLDYYRRAGVAGVSCLVFGQYSLWAYGANVEAFARAVTGGAVHEAVDAWAGGAAPLAAYLAALERVMRGVVTYGDVRLPPRHGERAAAVHTALGTALAEGPTLRRLLAAAAGSSAPARLAAEGSLLEYTLATLAALRAWVAATTGRAGAAAEDAALEALAEALDHVRVAGPAAGTWGVHDLELTHAFYAALLRGA